MDPHEPKDHEAEKNDEFFAAAGVSAREARALELALGHESEGSEATDPRLASEVAELETLFGALRTNLTCAPTGRVAVALQSAVARRGSLLGDPARRWTVRRTLHFALRAAAVAAILVEGQVVLRRWHTESPMTVTSHAAVVADVTPRGSGSDPVAARPRLFRAPEDGERRVASTGPEATLGRLSAEFSRRYLATKAEADARGGGAAFSAENQLALRQLELGLCAAPKARHALLESVSDASLVEARVDALAEQIADEVAAVLPRKLGENGAEPRELAFVVRALVASGSTVESGPFAAAVRGAGHALADRLPALRDADLAFALGAFADLAALHEGRARELFSEHAARLCATILGSTFAHPSELLTWGCDAGALAEAGAVLRLAAAFGVPADSAYQARLLLLAHLQERAERLPGERPALAAAILYGFGELVDRKPWEHRLRLWHARDFLPDGTAVLHYTWSRGGLRAGWADLQRELRVLSTEPAPASLADRAGLLLALATSFAAPGAHALQATPER